jgi:hypothetical protein
MGWKRVGKWVRLWSRRQEGFRQRARGGAASRRSSERISSVVIMYSSTYTGRVAHLVAQMRSAKIQNRVFGEITRKKILFFWIFLILRDAHLVALGRVLHRQGDACSIHDEMG